MILYATMMVGLLFMAGMFFGSLLTDRAQGNQSHWTQYAFTVILSGLGVYYAVTLIGMIKRLA